MVMERIVGCLAATLAIVCGFSGPALADHNHPEKAKIAKINFVTAYEPCTVPTSQHRPPYDDPALACPPVLSTGIDVTHKITFAVDGRLAANVQVGKGDVKISFKGRGVLDDSAPYNGALQALVSLRATDNACTAPEYMTPCTLIDIPFVFDFGCSIGVCQGKTTVNMVLPDALRDGDNGNIEIGQITVIDPDGDQCFTQGLFVP